MEIGTIEHYLEAVHQVNTKWHLDDATTHAWYRGQGNKDWPLLPTIYRNGGDNKFERELIRDFKLNASQFLDRLPKNDLEWLFVMQHYGISTRLLDWSENYLTALYFAVLNYKTDIDATVWVLDGWTLNENVLGVQSIPTADTIAIQEYCIDNSEDDFNRTISARLPAAVRPYRSTPRIIAQKGTFTIHGNDKRSINEIIDDLNAVGSDGMYKYGLLTKINLDKIVIEGCYKKRILQNLMQAGISHSVLFPELEGLAKEINFRYSNEYLSGHGHTHYGF